MTIANKTAFGLLLVLIAIGPAYLILGSWQEKLQANVYLENTKGSRGIFPPLQLAKTCPNQVVDVDSDEADYTLEVAWLGGEPDLKEGWAYDLKRKDGAHLEDTYIFEPLPRTDPNATRIARQVCRDIQRDFPLWLNTQRVRASVGKPAQMAAATSVDDDPPRRYEMTEYHNGPVVGIALLDTKLGRTWLLTNITDSGGKTVRTEFNEVSVEGLWKSADELYGDRNFSSSKFVRDEADRFFELKKLTRPIAIQRAEEQADKER